MAVEGTGGAAGGEASPGSRVRATWSAASTASSACSARAAWASSSPARHLAARAARRAQVPAARTPRKRRGRRRASCARRAPPSRLQSEHVARVIDVGALEDGVPVHGDGVPRRAATSAAARASAGRCPSSDAVDFVLQAARPIAEAHALGIVHRDLKPANLFLARRRRRRAAREGARLRHLEGAREVERARAERSRRPATIMGSPLYMSPEQIRSSKNVDARTDIWALGVILYELLAGRLPFEAETVTELCAQIAADPPAPLRAHRPDVPAGARGRRPALPREGRAKPPQSVGRSWPPRSGRSRRPRASSRSTASPASEAPACRPWRAAPAGRGPAPASRAGQGACTRRRGSRTRWARRRRTPRARRSVGRGRSCRRRGDCRARAGRRRGRGDARAVDRRRGARPLRHARRPPRRPPPLPCPPRAPAAEPSGARAAGRHRRRDVLGALRDGRVDDARGEARPARARRCRRAPPPGPRRREAAVVGRPAARPEVAASASTTSSRATAAAASAACRAGRRRAPARRSRRRCRPTRPR